MKKLIMNEMVYKFIKGKENLDLQKYLNINEVYFLFMIIFNIDMLKSER